MQSDDKTTGRRLLVAGHPRRGSAALALAAALAVSASPMLPGEAFGRSPPRPDPDAEPKRRNPKRPAQAAQRKARKKTREARK